MAERTLDDVEQLIREVSAEFAASPDRAHVRWLRPDRRERERGDLRWRDGAMLKEIMFSTGSWDRVEVAAALTEVARWRGRPRQGGAACAWRMGAVGKAARDLRERLLSLLAQAWDLVGPMGLADLRREHRAARAQLEQRLLPLLEEFAAEQGGQLYEHAGGEWPASLSSRGLPALTGVHPGVEWPASRPSRRLPVSIDAVEGIWLSDARVRGGEGWAGPRHWERLGLVGGNIIPDWTDLGELRATLRHSATFLDLFQAVGEHAAACGLHLGISDTKLESYWMNVSPGRPHRGLWKRIGLHGEEGLQIEVKWYAPELHPVIHPRVVGRVELDDPDLVPRVLSLIDEAWRELEPLGEEDLARARQESPYVAEHRSWWQRRRDHRARLAKVRALDPVLKDLADSFGAGFKRGDDYTRHLVWPRPRARITLSPSMFTDDAGYLQHVQLNYEWQEASGPRRGQWRSVGGVARVLLRGWGDVEGLRAGVSWLAEVRGLLARVATWAEDHGLTWRWKSGRRGARSPWLLTLEAGSANGKPRKRLVLVWAQDRIEVEAIAGEDAPEEKRDFRRWGSVPRGETDFADRVMSRLEKAWAAIVPMGAEDLRRAREATVAQADEHLHPVIEDFARAREGEVTRGSWADWVVRWPQAEPRYLIAIHAHPEHGLRFRCEARQKECPPGSTVLVQWVPRTDARPEQIADWLDTADLRAALATAGAALESERD
jgi:hypothetical protein